MVQPGVSAFRVEEENHRLAGEIFQMDGLLRVVLERKVGNFVVDFHFSLPQQMRRTQPRTIKIVS